MAYSLTLKRPRNSGMRAKVPSQMGNGSDGHLDPRIKVSAQHYYEKYIAMAHESVAVGDRITAESFYQYAEHYLRLINEFKLVAVEAQSLDKDDLNQENIYPIDKNAMLVAHAVTAKTQFTPEAEGSLNK